MSDEITTGGMCPMVDSAAYCKMVDDLEAQLVEKDKRIRGVEQEIAEKIYKIGNQATVIKNLKVQLESARKALEKIKDETFSSEIYVIAKAALDKGE